MPKPLRAVLIGAGNRGADAYGPYALDHPDMVKFVAVAEPNQERRLRFARQHHIPQENQFDDWKKLLSRPQLGEAALICTQDNQHVEPTLAAFRSGYHVLLEKPMATTLADCKLLVQIARTSSRQLHICHVLRYTNHFQKMKSILQSGDIGEIINIDHRENVAWYHMAHSYVRGHWRNSAESSPMILAKCCHDFDILIWLLERRCEKLSSMGALNHFRPENAPEGAPHHCLDGCPVEETCPYYAPFIYLGMRPIWRAISKKGKGSQQIAAYLKYQYPTLLKVLGGFHPVFRQAESYSGWPISVVAHDPTQENLTSALATGPYGRCVYHCDNNVVDHQVVAMQFQGPISVTLTMHGHSHFEGRTTRIQGTRGELQAFFGTGGSWIDIYAHRSGDHTHIDTGVLDSSRHGGGDFALMAAFVKSLSSSNPQGLTSAEEAFESHKLAFAAETARIKNLIMNTLNEFHVE